MAKFYEIKYKEFSKNRWKISPAEIVRHFIFNQESSYGYSESRKIEDQIETLSEVVGNMANLLIEKGLITKEEFLNTIGVSDLFEPAPEESD